MACLNWKSDALARVIRPLPKGTGDPPKRHLRGNVLNPSRTRSIRVFSCTCSHPHLPYAITESTEVRPSPTTMLTIANNARVARLARLPQFRGQIMPSEREKG